MIPVKSFLRFLGSRYLRALKYIGGLAILLFDALWWIAIAPWSGKGRLRYEETLRHMKTVSIRSVGVVALVVFFVGMTVALQMAYVLKTLGVTEYIANITAVAMAREMSPLLVAVVMTGFVGAAIAAEIGTMVVSEEVLALETSSLNPIRFLVVPRVLASMIMLPFVCLIATYIGVFGGFVVGCCLLGMESEKYLHRTFESLSMLDVLTGLIKSEAFGLLIALVACKEGFNVSGGAEGVGQATTRAVVRCTVGIILCDLLFTALFYFFL